MTQFTVSKNYEFDLTDKKDIELLKQRLEEWKKEQNEIQEIEEYTTLENLYDDIKMFLVEHLDLWLDIYYDILTMFIILTYRVEDLNEIPYLLILGPTKSGKTRILEILNELCYNPILSAVSSPAYIKRKVASGIYTILIDEWENVSGEALSTLTALLNAGYRKGMKACLTEPKGNDWVPVELDTFGPKVIASIKAINGTLESRLITITAIKNARKVRFRVDKEKAEHLRIKLHKYQAKEKAQPIEDLANKLKEEMYEYRNLELFVNLISIAPLRYRPRLLEYLRQVDDEKSEEDGMNFYAEVVSCVDASYDKSTQRVRVNDVLSKYNSDKDSSELASPRQMGQWLSDLGFNRICRFSDGQNGRRIALEHLTRVKARYGQEQVTLVPTT